jgi:hypothetical protein
MIINLYLKKTQNRFYLIKYFNLLCVISFICSTQISFSQSSDYNRPEITVLFSNPYDLGPTASDVIQRFRKPESIKFSYIEHYGGGNISPLYKIPSDWYVQKELFRFKDNYDLSDKQSIPHFPNVDYNQVDNPIAKFSFIEASENPDVYLKDYSKEIFRFIFTSVENDYTFKLDRIVKRTMINANDYLINLSKEVARGDNIIKDNIKIVFDNIYIVGIELDSYKFDRSIGWETLKAKVYLFKLDYSTILNNNDFWRDCFSSINSADKFSKYEKDIKITLLKNSNIQAVINSSKGMSINSVYYQFMEGVFKKFN